MDKIASSFATNTNNLINDVEEVQAFKLDASNFSANLFQKTRGEIALELKKLSSNLVFKNIKKEKNLLAIYHNLRMEKSEKRMRARSLLLQKPRINKLLSVRKDRDCYRVRLVTRSKRDPCMRRDVTI